jgi:hypothetical protein
MPHKDGKRGVDNEVIVTDVVQTTKTRTQEMGAVDTYSSPKTGELVMRLTPSNGKQDRNIQRKTRIN